MLISVLRVIALLYTVAKSGFPSTASVLHWWLLHLRRVCGLHLGSMRREETSSSHCRPVCTLKQARFPKDLLPLPLNIYWPHPSVWNSWADISPSYLLCWCVLRFWKQNVDYIRTDLLLSSFRVLGCVYTRSSVRLLRLVQTKKKNI